MTPGTRIVELACGHAFDVDSLDGLVADFEGSVDGVDRGSAVQVPTCPECRQPLEGVLRYKDVVRRCQARVDAVKRLFSVDAVVAQGAALIARPDRTPAEVAEYLGRAANILNVTPAGRVTALSRVRVLQSLAAWMRVTGDAAAAAEAVDRVLREQIAHTDRAAGRLQVDIAMTAAETVLHGDHAHEGDLQIARMRAMELWGHARRAAELIRDRELLQRVIAAADGTNAKWAIAAMVQQVGRGHAFQCP